MNKRELTKMKMLAANAVAILLVLLLCSVVLMSIGGWVNLESPAISLFVGQLIGSISGLLAGPMVFYFGHHINSPPPKIEPITKLPPAKPTKELKEPQQ